MATKRKTKKKSKRTAGGKVTTPKKQVQKGKTLKKSAKKKAAQNKSVAARKVRGQKAISGKAADAGNTKTRRKSQGRNALVFSRDASESRSAEQSGDLQGLSNVESADSQSVDELVEEGNAFEAGVVTGVEDAGERGERELRTREVPEDDVPGEYLDKD